MKIKNLIWATAAVASVILQGYSVQSQEQQIAFDYFRQARQNRYVEQMLQFNPTTVESVLTRLDTTEAQEALKVAAKGYDARAYTFGDTVTSWSLAQDPLSSRCLRAFERYKGLNCVAGNADG